MITLNIGPKVRPKTSKVLLVTGFSVLSGMTIYEYLKQWLWPDISIWQSHIVTISFTSVLAIFIAVAISHTYNALINALLGEQESRRQAEKELQKQNERLREEIEQRKKAQEALRESEEQYRAVFDNAGIGIDLLDRHGRIVKVNQALLNILGYGEAELSHLTFLEITHPDDKEISKRKLEALMVGEIDSYRLEKRYVRKDGSIVWVDLWSSNIRDAKGEHVGTVAVIEDITDHKWAEEALLASESAYRTLSENIPGIVYRVHMDEPIRMEFFNSMVETITGFTEDELKIGDLCSMDPLILPEDRVKAVDFVKQAFGNNEPFELEYRIKHKSGEIRSVLDHGRPIRGLEGGPSYIDGVILDITERKQAENSLRASEQRLELALWGTDLGLWDWDVQSGLAVVNEQAAKIIGYSLDEIEQSFNFWKNLLHPDDSQESLQKVFDVLKGVTDYYEDEYRVRTKSGEWKWILSRGKVVERDDEGRAVRVTGTYLDISGRKCAEEALRVSEQRVKVKLDSILEPEGDIGALELSDIIDTQAIQSLMDSFFQLTNTGVGIIDLHGKVLVATGWQDICTQFHRIHPETCQYCVESDTVLSQDVPLNTFKIYKCKNNMWDIATPIMIGEKHMGNLFLGQFFFVDEYPEYEIFRAQARQYGFNEEEYLAALERVPRWTKQTVNTVMTFYAQFARMISTLSYSSIKLARTLTERTRAEEALRESEEKYRVLVERAHEGILVAQDGIHRFVNPAAANIWGYSQEELLSRPLGEFIHPDDRDMVVDRSLRRAEGGEIPGRYDHRVLTKDGKTKWVEIDSGAISWKGSPAVLVFATDVTDRRNMEEALKEREEWYRTLVEESFDGIFVQKGPKIVFANSRLYEMLGYSAGELEGQEHWLVYHPDYRAITSRRAIARMLGKDPVSQYEVKLQRKDGTSFDGEISARAVTVRGGPGVQVWLRDISGRKRSELARRRLATAVEQAEETIMITDPSGSIQYVNPAFEKTTGFTTKEALGKNPSILKSGRHGEELYRDLWNSITHGKVWKGRFVNRRKNGTLFSEDATISPVRDRTGRIVNFVAVKRDVTEGLALQQQLLQAQKMEATGTLAGGIAHDFNNLLTVVMGFSELLLAEKEQDHPEYADLQKIFHAAKNGADLVQRLLMFSRKSEPKPVPMNLNKQIVQVEKLLRRTIPRMVDIGLELSPDLPRIDADPSQVEQVLMNLAVNARDAMPDKGKLTVRTDILTLDEEYCRLQVEASPGEYVVLGVSDTGHGMDKQTLEHIFEPFFTTKEMGRGTGLGLAMVYGIVKQHNGHITVHSEVGHGTTFQVYLPAIPGEAETGVETSEEAPAFGTETVLLVDDEEYVRELGARILTKQGYTVLQAENGKKALDLFDKERSQISLVILDLIMPKMGGKECLKELLKIDPQVNVLVASGYSADASVEDTIQMGAKSFVAKPFRSNDLLRDVRRVLDRS